MNGDAPGRLGLNDEELRDVLARAQEISLEQSYVLREDEVAQYVDAAAEAGIPRDATLQALRERLALIHPHLSEGQLVFAKSGDGRFHAARLVKVETNSATVRFVSGGESVLKLDELRAFSLTPGSKLQHYSSLYGSWITAQVTRFNAEANSVTLSTWGTEETVPLDKVRLPVRHDEADFTDQAYRAGVWLVGGLAGGGAIGALVTWLLMR